MCIACLSSDHDNDKSDTWYISLELSTSFTADVFSLVAALCLEVIVTLVIMVTILTPYHTKYIVTFCDL